MYDVGHLVTWDEVGDQALHGDLEHTYTVSFSRPHKAVKTVITLEINEQDF